MKSFSSSAAMAAVALPMLAAAQPFWSGAPACVKSCISSAYSSSAFPSPTAFCAGSGGPPIASCLSASCGSSTPAAVSTFSSLSSSLCSRYSSCVSAGSTGVVTVTATAGSSGFGGPYGGGPGGGPFGGGPFATGSHSHWPSDGATTTFTVTGCPWATGGWFGAGGPGGGSPGGNWGGSGWGGGGIWGGGGFWGSSQNGWAYRTATTTVTTTFTSAGNLVTATGIATVEEAASGGLTSTTTFFDAQVTGATTGSGGGTTSSGAGAARALSLGGSGSVPGNNDGWATVKIVGLALGTMMAVVGML